jgi:hypothetical protein
LNGREKIEKAYRESEERIEKEVAEELSIIKEKANKIIVEVEKIGEALENSVKVDNEVSHKKKS